MVVDFDPSALSDAGMLGEGAASNGTICVTISGASDAHAASCARLLAVSESVRPFARM